MHESMVERTDTQLLFNVKMTETSLFPRTLLSQKASTQSPRISNVYVMIITERWGDGATLREDLEAAHVRPTGWMWPQRTGRH